MADYPVDPKDIRRIYSDLAEDVLLREERLQDELPIDMTAEIHNHLDSTVHDWEIQRKSLRAIPVSNVYAHQLDRDPAESLKRRLTGLDALVNVLDDIIDTRELTTQTKISLTVNAAFSSTLIVEGCSSEKRSEIQQILREYFTALFQIPLVEQRLFSVIEDATEQQQRQHAAQQIYSYRSRDIDAFARLAAIETNMEADQKQTLLKDLRVYRARRLLFKDIHDVERDVADEDMTPVIQFLEQHDSIEPVVESIEDLYSQFSYSQYGNGRYGDLLRELEKAPEDLQSTLSDKQQVVSSTTLP